MRIIFMGTPDFAVPSLEILINAGFSVVAVITSSDKYGGRGRKTLIESPVKLFAKKNDIKILQPPNLKNKNFLKELSDLNADLQIVVAFRMLPRQVWDMPSLGTFNLHGSLLPAYRGAAPINWAIINGETSTGVTSFKLKHEIDTGSIFLQTEVPIYPSDDATALHDRMKYVAADTVYETAKALAKEKVKLSEQDSALVSHAPKLNKANTELDFSRSTTKLHNMVRGLSQYPVAWFKMGKHQMKVYNSSIEPTVHTLEYGTVLSDNKTYIKVACSDGFLKLEKIQLTGKKKMLVSDFLNGFDIAPLAKITHA